VPLATKKARLDDIISLQRKHSFFWNEAELGQIREVLIEGSSKKSDDHWYGRTPQNTVVVFPKTDEKPGDFVHVLIESCTTATLLGKRI
jgi:tRNA-2-methylthio-N6-dimethylallyladenosine synthase